MQIKWNESQEEFIHAQWAKSKRYRAIYVSEQDGNKTRDVGGKWVIQYGMQNVLIHSEWNIT